MALAFGALVVGCVVILPLFVVACIVAWVRHRRGLAVAMGTAAALLAVFLASPLPRMGAGAVYLAVPAARMALVRADLAISRAARESIVRQVDAGDLAPGEWANEYVLPEGAKGLSVHGTVDVIDSSCGRIVFFMTLTGFSPDPYAGMEYVPPGCSPEVDPLGSGQGKADDLGDGWYWIQAR